MYQIYAKYVATQSGCAVSVVVVDTWVDESGRLYRLV